MANNIIINFPTNIGDTILALPVLDRIKANYPQSRMTGIASGHTYSLLERNNFIDKVILFDKRWSIKQKIKFSLSIRGEYNLMVDLKNSFLPVIAGVKSRTPFIRIFPKDMHIKDRYLSLIKKLVNYPSGGQGELSGKEKISEKRGAFILSKEEMDKWERYNFPPSIFIACSSHSLLKRYPYDYLTKVVKRLKEEYHLIILGENSDAQVYGDILGIDGITNLVGKTTVSELFYLIEHYARLVLCVDSSILHIASYLNKPVVAIFGPTPFQIYGPYSRKASSLKGTEESTLVDNSVVLRKEGLKCAPCRNPQCPFDVECMKIPPEKVIEAVKQLLKKTEGKSK